MPVMPFMRIFLMNLSQLAKNPETSRLIDQILIGPNPSDKQMDHLCRVRSCCNPLHLEPVTASENTRRGLPSVAAAFHRAKTHCPQGHPYTPENLYFRSNGRWRRCKACCSIRD